MEQTKIIEGLRDQLVNSHWPKCNTLAEELGAYKNELAKDALIEALNAKRHHVRTAAIRELVKFGDDSVLEAIRPLLDDRSYETRMEAKAAIETIEK